MEAHVNEHGDGVVAVVGRKEVVGLLPLAPQGGAAPQAMQGVLPMLCHTAAIPVGNDGLQACCYAHTALQHQEKKYYAARHDSREAHGETKPVFFCLLHQHASLAAGALKSTAQKQRATPQPE